MNQHGAARVPNRQLGGRREQILAIVRASSALLSIASITDEPGVHNTVRFHLDALIDTDRVERVLGGTDGPGRPPITYRARRAMDRNGPSNDRLVATILTSQLAASTRNPGKMAPNSLGLGNVPCLMRHPAVAARIHRR